VASGATAAAATELDQTHNLLTIHRGMIYYNTHLGAVACLSARDGRVRWIATYDRAMPEDDQRFPPHRYRDLTPCLYWRGIVFAAPSDSPSIFALDAASGERLWDSEHPPSARGRTPADAVFLLGVGAGRLIAGGDRLYWIDARSGEVEHCWPDGGQAQPRGFGRGVLIGEEILWPTREAIYTFSQRTGSQVRPPISLAARGTTGGHLLAAAGRLLIAGDRGIAAFAYAPAPRQSLERQSLEAAADGPP
jgi:hypothetical protein